MLISQQSPNIDGGGLVGKADLAVDLAPAAGGRLARAPEDPHCGHLLAARRAREAPVTRARTLRRLAWRR